MSKMIYKDSIILDIKKLMGKDELSDKTIERYIAEADSSLVEGSGLNCEERHSFIHGKFGNKKAIMLSSDYQNLFCVFVALRQDEVFEVVSRSKYYDTNRKKQKSKGNALKTFENMSEFDINKTGEFLTGFVMALFKYITPEERKVLNYYLNKNKADVSFNHIMSLMEFESELSYFIKNFYTNYDDSMEYIIKTLSHQISDINHMLNENIKEIKKQGSDITKVDFGNIYRGIYVSIAEAIKYIFENGIKPDENIINNENQFMELYDNTEDEEIKELMNYLDLTFNLTIDYYCALLCDNDEDKKSYLSEESIAQKYGSHDDCLKSSDFLSAYTLCYKEVLRFQTKHQKFFDVLTMVDDLRSDAIMSYNMILSGKDAKENSDFICMENLRSLIINKYKLMFNQLIKEYRDNIKESRQNREKNDKDLVKKFDNAIKGFISELQKNAIEHKDFK